MRASIRSTDDASRLPHLPHLPHLPRLPHLNAPPRRFPPPIPRRRIQRLAQNPKNNPMHPKG